MNTDTATTNTDRQRYLDQMTAFGTIVHDLPQDRWGAPSPCADWTAADVVDHVVDTQRDFLLRHDLTVDGRPAGDPVSVWEQHLATARSLTDETFAIRFDGFFGPTTIGATLAGVYGFDLIVHRWDLARAGGLATSFTSAEMDALDTSIAGFGDHLYAEGICAPAVPAPEDASRQDTILALLGREPGVTVS